MSKKPIIKQPRNPLFVPDKQYDQTRQAYNKMILALLHECVEKHPSLRFGQILQATGVLDFDLVIREPWELYARIREKMDELDENT